MFFLSVQFSFATGQLWTINPASPILYKTQTWESNFIQEPDVINFGGTNWVMFFASGPYSIGRATSTDGINWTDSATNPIIGSGFGNQSGNADHAGIYYDGVTLYIFYSDSNAGGNLIRQQSTDYGVTWTNKTTVLPSSGAPGNFTGYDTAFVVLNNGTYYLWVESSTSDTPKYEILLYTSTDFSTWSIQNGGNPLTSLKVQSNAMFGGPTVKVINGIFYMWYHANRASSGVLPTECSNAYSSDGITWTTFSQSVQPLGNQINLGSPQLIAPINQTADCRAIEVAGKSYLYYTRVATAQNAANIGVATYNGTLAELINTENTKSIGNNLSLPKGQLK